MNLKLKDLGKKFIFSKIKLKGEWNSPIKSAAIKNRIHYKTHPFPNKNVIPSSEVFDDRGVYVRVSHFNRLKLSLVAMFVVVAALGVTLYQLNKKSQLQVAENYRLQSKISSLKIQVDTAVNSLNTVNAEKMTSSSRAVGYIQGIQAKLNKINEYLSKRGLKVFSFKHISIDANKPKSDEKLFSNYNDYLSRLVNNVAAMPMGYPRESSFTSFFGYRGNPFEFGGNEFHPGIDFRGKVGDLVKCTASGVVIFTGRAGGYGNCVRIKHVNSIETWYGHLSRILVHNGEKVTVGEVIGRVGSTGRSTGPHLHYEVRKKGRPVNPAKYFTLNS